MAITENVTVDFDDPPKSWDILAARRIHDILSEAVQRRLGPDVTGYFGGVSISDLADIILEEHRKACKP